LAKMLGRHFGAAPRSEPVKSRSRCAGEQMGVGFAQELVGPLGRRRATPGGRPGRPSRRQLAVGPRDRRGQSRRSALAPPPAWPAPAHQCPSRWSGRIQRVDHNGRTPGWAARWTECRSGRRARRPAPASPRGRRCRLRGRLKPCLRAAVSAGRNFRPGRSIAEIVRPRPRLPPRQQGALDVDPRTRRHR